MDQIEQVQAAVSIALRDRDDEPKICGDEVGLGALGGSLASPDGSERGVQRAASSDWSRIARGAHLGPDTVECSSRQADAQETFDNRIPRACRNAAGARQRTGPLERGGNGANGRLLVVDVFVEGGPRDVAQAQLPVAEGAAKGAQLARSYRAPDERAQC